VLRTTEKWVADVALPKVHSTNDMLLSVNFCFEETQRRQCLELKTFPQVHPPVGHW
jgi:hypothetical protein